MSVDPFHLFRYVDEQVHRFNNRGTNDRGRFVDVLASIVDRRLTSFKGPWLKVDRAKRHIADLNDQIGAYGARHPYSLQIEPDPQQTSKSVVVRVREDVPCDFVSVIGDAIHNLRTALDLLAVEVVRANGGDVADVYFPFTVNPKELESTIKNRHIDQAIPEVAAVVRVLEPYPGGKHCLWELHDLDRMDKHRLLIPVSHIGNLPNTWTGGITITGASYGPIHDGFHLIAGLPMDANVQIDQNFEPTITIKFGKFDRQGPFENQAVLPVLYQLAEFVDRAIAAFAEIWGLTHTVPASGSHPSTA